MAFSRPRVVTPHSQQTGTAVLSNRSTTLLTALAVSAVLGDVLPRAATSTRVTHWSPGGGPPPRSPSAGCWSARERHLPLFALILFLTLEAAALLAGRSVLFALGFPLANVAEAVLVTWWLRGDEEARPRLRTWPDYRRWVAAILSGSLLCGVITRAHRVGRQRRRAVATAGVDRHHPPRLLGRAAAAVPARPRSPGQRPGGRGRGSPDLARPDRAGLRHRRREPAGGVPAAAAADVVRRPVRAALGRASSCSRSPSGSPSSPPPTRGPSRGYRRRRRCWT